MPAISHKTKLLILKTHLRPEILAEGPKMYAREMKNLNDLLKKYPEEQFWLDLHPGYGVRSLAWFKGEGFIQIEQAWRLYLFAKAQEKKEERIESENANFPENPLDTESNSRILESPPIKKKQSVLEWADSATTIST